MEYCNFFFFARKYFGTVKAPNQPFQVTKHRKHNTTTKNSWQFENDIAPY